MRPAGQQQETLVVQGANQKKNLRKKLLDNNKRLSKTKQNQKKRRGTAAGYMGLPLPLPMPPCCCWLPGFFIVSSTERIMQAASDAAVSALIFIMAGSHTKASMLSLMSSL
eukprot:comp21884_c0_seq1/m.31331 comp21884_c0_seq1/g.31331  ORF comp21884_c0_seq1/g.31331 comp21884_c0_seq1/m.31331 type:complete len:111 (+) comp21884_c0_seq1:259-591(+)